MNRDHVWHMETLAGMCKANAYQQVDVRDTSSTDAAIEWWQELTGAGGQGMVVKPLEFVARGRHGLVQPAIKCRGREYLRIIYGPEYLLPGTWNRCVLEQFRQSARWRCVSLHSASRLWNDL